MTDRLIDRGTLSEVRKIIDAMLTTAVQDEKRANKLNRNHFAETNIPGDFIPAHHKQDICGERCDTLRQLIQHMKGLSVNAVEMAEMPKVPTGVHPPPPKVANKDES